MATEPSPETTTALDALYRACRACAENIAEFDTITDPEILRDLTVALERVDVATTDPEPSAAETLDNAMVDALAAAMKAKLARTRAKGRGGWQDPAACSVRDLWNMLIEHAHKPNLDMVDVAALAGMIRWRLEHVIVDPAVLTEHLSALAMSAQPVNEVGLLSRLTEEVTGQLSRRTAERDRHAVASKEWFSLEEQRNTLENVLHDMRFALENSVTRLEFMRSVALNRPLPSAPERPAQAAAVAADQPTDEWAALKARAEAAEAQLEDATRALRNVNLLANQQLYRASRGKPLVADDWKHAKRYCRDGGVQDSVLRVEGMASPDAGPAELEAHWKAGFLRGAKHWYGVAQGVPEAQQWTMWQSEQRDCWAAAHACWPPAPGALEDARQICALHHEAVKADGS